MNASHVLKFAAAALLSASAAIHAQPNSPVAGVAAAAVPAVPEAQLRSTYLLGPDDQISIRAVDADEISDKPVRIDVNGNIRLPMLGRLKASGLTIEQLEAEIAGRLKSFINDPDVSVSIVEFRSQPVSVLGAVRNPGVQQLQGRKTLIEVLSLAGGLAEDAGHSVKITRELAWGRIPLPSAVDDPSGQFSVAEVSLKGIMEASNPAENIVIKPNDIISIPQAEMIYVTGQVQHAGGFVLRERETLTALQALSLAGGLDHYASPQSARILRQASSKANRDEIEVDLKKIMAGQSSDVPLRANDILLIPASAPKKAIVRAAEAALQVGTGLAIYRP